VITNNWTRGRAGSGGTVRLNIYGLAAKATGESKTGGAKKRGGVTMAIYIPSVRKGACDSAVIWGV
jgi:hypothetical protein